jgi:hypothetical protein
MSSRKDIQLYLNPMICCGVRVGHPELVLNVGETFELLQGPRRDSYLHQWREFSKQKMGALRCWLFNQRQICMYLLSEGHIHLM